MRIFIVSFGMVLLAIAVRAEAPDHLDPFEAFQLWTGCQPVYLSVGLETSKTEIDLTEEAVEIATRSRLRSARLYADEWTGVAIFVTINVFDVAFNIDVELFKTLVDREFAGREGIGITWGTGFTGTHGNDSNYILTSVSQLIDEFLDEYLRVNADAC